ncbi:unnamed protein product [marine sediment metagenome]|uniref:Uncharacterized protein n=1 Tax=marine sediment metagenome TaxID=412755 RepID=X1B6N6_9ZZZZ
MGKTGNRITELTLRVDKIENFFERFKHSLEHFKIPAARAGAMQSLVSYIIAIIPPEELEKIFTPESTPNEA